VFIIILIKTLYNHCKEAFHLSTSTIIPIYKRVSMNNPVITMNPLPLLIGIIVVLVMLCSPVLAFDKSDILSSYNVESAQSQDTPE